MSIGTNTANATAVLNDLGKVRVAVDVASSLSTTTSLFASYSASKHLHRRVGARSGFSPRARGSGNQPEPPSSALQALTFSLNIIVCNNLMRPVSLLLSTLTFLLRPTSAPSSRSLSTSSFISPLPLSILYLSWLHDCRVSAENIQYSRSPSSLLFRNHALARTNQNSSTSPPRGKWVNVTTNFGAQGETRFYFPCIRHLWHTFTEYDGNGNHQALLHSFNPHRSENIQKYRRHWVNFTAVSNDLYTHTLFFLHLDFFADQFLYCARMSSLFMKLIYFRWLWSKKSEVFCYF